jgi:hypothetical protein
MNKMEINRLADLKLAESKYAPWWALQAMESVVEMKVGFENLEA